MTDAAYHRAQAKLCKELGRHLTSVEDARLAFAAAARHLLQAEEIEERAHLDSKAKPPNH